MRTLLALLIAFLALTGDALAQGKLELTEVDAWLVRDAQMSSQFAVADQLGYFKAEGIKVTPRWYIAGTDLPSMWGAGDRKSTRLNSSHGYISYAVFCLKKKNKIR